MQKYIILFGLGGFGYGLIAVLWRGYSHPTMVVAGGLCFVAFYLIGLRLSHLPLLYRCVLASLAVTAIELVFGVIFNLFLKMKVWDYSNIPLNLFGQVCLLFTVLWGFLSLIALPFAKAVGKRFDKKESFR